jgi:hypothetical protein
MNGRSAFRWIDVERAVVAQQCPEHVDAAAGQSDQGRLVFAPLG